MRVLSVILLLFLPATASAQYVDYCEDLWVARNMMFDRSGYCFGSVLGQTLFDNGNCTTSSPTLPQEYAEAVTRMRAEESRVGCAINTSQAAWPSIRSITDFYNQFWSIPEPLDGGYACWGYSGPTVTFYAGASLDTPVMGTLTTGLSYSTGSWGLPGWQFYTISTGPGGQNLFSGWARHGSFDSGTCAQEAG